MTFLMKTVYVGDDDEGMEKIFEIYFANRTRYLNRFHTNGFRTTLKEMSIEGRAIKFQIWNLNRKQRFNAVRSAGYLASLGALIQFDATRKKSFENCAGWVKEIWTNNGKGTIPIVLLGNKSDLRHSSPDSISIEVADRYARRLSEQTKKHGFDVQYFDTNDKTGLNIEKAFEELGRVYFRYLKKQKKKSI